MKRLLLLLLLMPSPGLMAQSVTLIPTNSSWKYLANGSNQGTAWRATSFVDASWSTGNAELGYGDGGEATVVSYGPSAYNKYITTYFRKSFTVSNPASYSALSLQLLRDDGAVVYLNGTEVARSNMPTGTILYNTRATTAISGTGETTYYTYTPALSLLITGTNVIAVEIHQSSPFTPDMSFNLSLTATTTSTCGTPGSLTSTSVSSTGATISWGSVSGATSYNLRYRVTGTSTWTTVSGAATSSVLTGLLASTAYEYSVQAVCASGSGSYSANSTFTTSAAPSCGTPGSLTASAITSTGATISWSNVSGATSYNLRYRVTGTSTWTTVSGAATSSVLTGLTSSTSYEYSVRAICTSVTGNYSANSTFTTSPSASCGIPGSLSANSISTTGATINWGSVSGATSYNVNYRVSGTSTWTTTTSATTNKILTGLNSGTLYEYRIQAVCSAATGSFSGNATFSTLTSGNDSLITTFTSWKYLDNGSNQGTAWRAAAFSDAAWASGNAELGYGDGDEATTVSYGTNSSAKYITTYFRKSFNVSNPAAYLSLNLSVVRDDGIVVYINGTEVYRNNMPTGTIAYNTLSPTAIGSTDESAWNTAAISPAVLIAGTNVIAVEIHQQALTSSDISFKARLVGSGTVTLPTVTRGAYIQKVTPTTATIRWRTNVASDSKVNFGITTGYGSSVSDATSTTEHVVTITGLSPGTRYYYSIGTIAGIIQGNNLNNFYTAPVAGSSSPVRIWATGDFGNGSTQQAAVRNSFATYSGTTPTNLWIWLGDNAYSTGTDAEYQSYVFNVYPDQLKSIPLYPAPGNHDYGNAGYQTTSTLGTNFPYFSSFSVFQSAEGGGIASNTPKYYSYNYANIHFISLDSYGSYNNTSSAMYSWLSNDLAANTQRWTIVYFHHPPYTKGTHNSDSDAELINMRTNIIPLLENYHVDLVLCGHSHINERSYLIKGHYGNASSFTQAMKISASSNTFTKTAPYDGTVYAVCGTSGQNPPGTPQAGYPMPCMAFNNNTNNCSLVMDVNGDNLTCRYLASTGSIVDQFTITKTGARVAAPSKFETFKIGFDPDEGAMVIDYHLEQESKIHISYHTLSGQLVLDPGDQQETLPSGFHRIYLENPSLSSGLYVLKVRINGQNYYGKLIVP